MKQTALYQAHLQLKAKMADFYGWQMPLQYTGLSEEYHAVRAAAGLFDVGHLGRIELAGPGAVDLLQKTFTRNLSKLPEGSAVYGLLCNDTGFILDDVMLFHLPAGQGLSGAQAENRYLITTNAVNTDKILSWLTRHAAQGIRITDSTSALAQLALQGLQSGKILEKLIMPHQKKMKPRSVKEIPLLETTVVVSRTGYTGEQGYELFAPAGRAEALWNAVLEAGKEAGVLPCGLESRDILRIEMGYPLYGKDLDETRNPLEAGLDHFIDLKKDFIGRDALLRLKAEGVKQKLVGFALLEKGVPKSGGSIYSENREIGVVTSSAQSPAFKGGIGLGYVLSRYAQQGQEIEIEVKDRELAAKIAELPFYRKK